MYNLEYGYYYKQMNCTDVSTAFSTLIRYSTEQYNSPGYSTAQCNSVGYCAVLYNSLGYSSLGYNSLGTVHQDTLK